MPFDGFGLPDELWLLSGTVAFEACSDCLDGGFREGPDRAGVEIRVAVEDRELGACLVERHSTTASTGA